VGHELEASDDEDVTYTDVIIQNSSKQSVYQLIASLVATQGAFRRTAVGDPQTDYFNFRAVVGQVPPGEYRTKLRGGEHAMYVRFAVEIAFQDATGHNWVRYGQGKLEETKEDPVSLYNSPVPIDWEVG
jgi:hypothetical protein